MCLARAYSLTVHLWLPTMVDMRVGLRSLAALHLVSKGRQGPTTSYRASSFAKACLVPAQEDGVALEPRALGEFTQDKRVFTLTSSRSKA